MAQATAHHVLALTQNYFPGRGGMARSCERIVRGLRSAARVDVVHLVGGDAAPRAVSQVGGQLLTWSLDEDLAHGLNVLWSRLESDPATAGITHVLAFGGHLPLAAAPVYAAWLDRPLITLLRGNDFDSAVFHAKRADVLREALERSAAVCAVTRTHQRRVRALVPRADVEWIPNGIAIASFQPDAHDQARAAAWRAEHVAPGRRVLGLFGHLKRKKGALLMLEALASTGLGDRLHLLLVGEAEPDVLAWLDAQVGELTCTRLPFLEPAELATWYAACDFVGLPSFYDGMPNVMLEAAAGARPFVAAAAGGMADWLVNGQHGFVFAPGDADACARALVAAVRTRDEDLARMGHAARALLEDGLDERTEARRYLGVLERTTAAWSRRRA